MCRGGVSLWSIPRQGLWGRGKLVEVGGNGSLSMGEEQHGPRSLDQTRMSMNSGYQWD